MKQIIERLQSMAKLFLVEEQAIIINNYIGKERWQALRLYLADLSEEYELNNLVVGTDQQVLSQWLVVDMMNDIAIDLAVQMQERLDEENKPKQRRKRVIRS